VEEAPVLVVITIENSPIVPKLGKAIKNMDYPYIDIGIAAEHFCLQATEEGLGTCMLGWFNEKPIQQLLNIPRKRKIGLVISVGYEPEGYKMREKIRKDISKVVSYNKY
jgi:nitroreductase